jgi:hypothetical protein
MLQRVNQNVYVATQHSIIKVDDITDSEERAISLHETDQGRSPWFLIQ